MKKFFFLTSCALVPSFIASAWLLPVAQGMYAAPTTAALLGYSLRRWYRAKKFMSTHAEKMWLLENGQQLVIETMDGVLHKVNIMNNDSYEIVDRGKYGLVFLMDNSARTFYFATKFAVKADINMLDRVVRGIQVDTKKNTRVFHHQLAKE